MPRTTRTLGRIGTLAAACLFCATASAYEPDPVLAPQPESAGDNVPEAGIAPVPQALPGAAGVAYPPPATWYGEYRVGHIKKPWFSNITHRSAYNPYVDLIGQPLRQRVYGNRHARYYVTYRSLYRVNWGAMYLPSAPSCPPGGYPAHVSGQPNPRAPYGAASATYFGGYGY